MNLDQIRSTLPNDIESGLDSFTSGDDSVSLGSKDIEGIFFIF